MTTLNPQTILLAHGSRDSNWCNTFEYGRALVQESLDQQVTLAFMELAEPKLETVIETAIEQGQTAFVVHPMFFAAGKHLLIDVPRRIKQLKSLYPGVTIELLSPLGKDAMFWRLIAETIKTSHGARETGGFAQTA